MTRKPRRRRKTSNGGNGYDSVEEQLREEYAYVLRDLRHILLLAAAMFILLIVLNLIL
ncbi:MAG TPA: hypothetical protein VK879_15445 [Candidatus Sulfomarinibacteraceae bacterium]|nr:hypothetical protein [Candidatus Sulfomarinibacteraceae bacterium]